MGKKILSLNEISNNSPEAIVDETTQSTLLQNLVKDYDRYVSKYGQDAIDRRITQAINQTPEALTAKNTNWEDVLSLMEKQVLQPSSTFPLALLELAISHYPIEAANPSNAYKSLCSLAISLDSLFPETQDLISSKLDEVREHYSDREFPYDYQGNPFRDATNHLEQSDRLIESYNEAYKTQGSNIQFDHRALLSLHELYYEYMFKGYYTDDEKVAKITPIHELVSHIVKYNFDLPASLRQAPMAGNVKREYDVLNDYFQEVIDHRTGRASESHDSPRNSSLFQRALDIITGLDKQKDVKNEGMRPYRNHFAGRSLGAEQAIIDQAENLIHDLTDNIEKLPKAHATAETPVIAKATFSFTAADRSATHTPDCNLALRTWLAEKGKNVGRS